MRSSPVGILIRLVQAAGGMLAIALLWWTAGRRLDGWTGTVVDVAFWAYVALRTSSVPLTWLTTTWQVDDAGIRQTAGWLARRQTVVAWADVVAVDVSQPYLHRLFGCFSVRFGLGTTQKSALRIDAVSRAGKDRVVAVARRAQHPVNLLPATGDQAAPADERADDEIYRIRPRDYLLVSLTHGQFVLFVPAVVSLLDQLDDWFDLPLPDPGVLLGWSRPEQLGALLGVLVLSMAYGWLSAWLRFRGFRVVRDRAGYVASGGLLSSETRIVEARRVIGLKVTQNPLMRVLGFGRVSVLTQDAGEQPMANLLFPVVRLSALPAALGAELAVNPEVVAPSLRLGRAARLYLCAAGVVAEVVLVGVAYALRPGWVVLSATAVTVVVALAVNSRWVLAVTVPERSRCYARRGVFWVSHVEFDLSAVQVVESSQGVLGRLSRTWSVALHYYDGRVRCVRAVGCGPDRRDALVAVLPR